LWAGCGGAILGIGLTESRSEIERLVRPLIILGTVFLVAYLYFALMPEHNERYETFTVLHFHDGDWLSATITLVVSTIYWVVRPKDRKGTTLFFWAAIAWWVGYGLLTKLGGLRLAPLHRSESWGGVLGVLVVLMYYLSKRKNYAALMLCLYGCIGGGLAFSTAVCLRHPLIFKWGPLANIQIPLASWRVTEDWFGALTGFAISLGTLRLLRGGIAVAEEDCDRRFTDVFAAFVIVVALAWMNFRRHFDRVLDDMPSIEIYEFLGLSTGAWYSLVAAIATLPALVVLTRYYLGDRGLFPQSAYGKGTAVVLIVLGTTAAAELLDGYPSRLTLVGNLCLWLTSALAVVLLISFAAEAENPNAVIEACTSPTDERWRVGRKYALAWVSVPFLLLGFTQVTTAIQNESHGEVGRRRFGEQAYWRQTDRLLGVWLVLGESAVIGGEIEDISNTIVKTVCFDTYRNVAAELSSGELVDEHRWFLKNQYLWMFWYSKNSEHPERTEVPLHFHEGKIYVKSPQGGSEKGRYLVLERRDD
jgi:hypothetical protein